jgi:sarcosine oxidase subunit beta
MKQRADCVVIGGGITGTSIAYHLTRAGRTGVVLLEKDHLASKATGVCPGGIRQQWATEAACLYAQYSVRFFESLGEELQPEFPLPFHQTGYLFLAHNEATLAAFEANVSLQNRLGISSEMLSPEETAKIVPGLEPKGLLGGTFCATDGFIEDADGLTQLLASRAKDQGARIVLEPAVSIDLKGNRVAGVRTPSGYIETPVVVNAAGCEAPSLAAPLGLELPIRVERRRLVYTDRLSERILDPLVAAMDIGWAGKQLIDGVIYMGYLRETSEKLDDWAYTERVVEKTVEVMPSLAEIGVKRLVDGLYDTTPDGHPFLGGVRGLEGYFQAAGFSGHGYMISPAVGKVMAELILGQEPSLPVEPFSFDRFQKGANQDRLVL